MSVNELLRDNPLAIVDIGASGGIDARWTRFTTCHQGILFEPDPREYERLRTNGSRQQTVLNAALSDAPATVDFHLCRKQETSSAFLPNFDFLSRFPQLERFDITRTVRMPTDTLDNQLREHRIEGIDFIKIDTQGFELRILKGSERALQQAVGLQVEVAFVPIYQDQPLFADVDAYVRSRGFELHDLNTHYWRRRDARQGKGQLVFADAVYFRPPEQLCANSGIPARKLVRALCVYLAYERADIARVLLQHPACGAVLSVPERAAALAAVAAVESRIAWRDICGLRRLRRAVAKTAARLRH